MGIDLVGTVFSKFHLVNIELAALQSLQHADVPRTVLGVRG